jgi:phosphomannomutase
LRRGAFHGASLDEPAVVLASDGEPRTAELIAAADEGLRLAGCNVVDVGSASVAAMRFAIDHLGADGGVLVAAQRSRQLPTSVRYWAPGSTPLDESGNRRVAEQAHAGVDRPQRRNGQSRRFDATTPYLATWRDSYHGLRPLRIALDSASLPVRRYIDALLTHSACRVIDGTLNERPAERITAADAHVGLRIDRFGEVLAVFDERGRTQRIPTDWTDGPGDSIVVLTALVQLLSQSDRPLSVALGTPSSPLPKGEGSL